MKSLDMAHQVWLQSLISHRIVTEVHAKALHKAAVSACSVTYRPTDYDDFFAKVAKAIGIVGLEIRRTVDESNGTHVMGIVNTKGDEIAQLATTFTPHEITHVKLMIEKIIMAPYQAFCIGSKEALDIAAKLSPPIAPTKAEMVCDKLVRHGWFRLSRAGRYSLSPRSVMELQSYLQSTYEDHILLCLACEEVLTSGFACSTVECDVRVHRHCMLQWERRLQGNERGEKDCSHCEQAWKTVPVGEAVLATSNATQRQARARVVQRRARADDDEEEDDEEGEQHEGTEDDVDGDEEEEEEEEDEDEDENDDPVCGAKRRSTGGSSQAAKRVRRDQEESDDDDPPSRRGRR